MLSGLPRVPLFAGALVVALTGGCGPRSVEEAETKRDIGWLVANPTAESVSALGRLADREAGAVKALEARAEDVNAYIAAWSAVTRDAPWGTAFLRSALADPTRAELASSAMPRKDARLTPFIPELENAVIRLAAGRRGGILAGLLASIGPAAHATVERRLADPKTRGAMCEGLALPDASGDAKSTLLAVPASSRDHASCVNTVIDMAATEDVVVSWLATRAEPGLLGAADKDKLACPRVAAMWKKALVERPLDQQSALVVPLQRSVARCSTAVDATLGELLAKAPRARPTIVNAIDPYGSELATMNETCAALRAGHANGEVGPVRERAGDAVARGCALAR